MGESVGCENVGKMVILRELCNPPDSKASSFEAALRNLSL